MTGAADHAGCLPGRPGRGLELGAGAGKATEYLKKQGFRMTALDLEPAGPEVEEGDMRSLLLPEECFDFCLAECSVSVCGDGDAALKEAYRVLKKGGVFSAVRCFFQTGKCPGAVHEAAADPGVLAGGFYGGGLPAGSVSGRDRCLEGVFSGMPVERERRSGEPGVFSGKQAGRAAVIF